MPSNLPKGSPISKETLQNLYLDRKMSLSEIANELRVSVHKVVYWMQIYRISRRGQPEANYLKHNPNGDPFRIRVGLTLEEEKLKSLALGIYWGEGSKADGHVVKVANTDPVLLGLFQRFLIEICQVKAGKARYYLQIFKDTDINQAKNFWSQSLGIDPSVILVSSSLPSLGKGTYRRINKHGVMSISVFNSHLKRYILSELEALGFIGDYSVKIEARKMVK